MAEKIKKFFAKKKADAKFKLAGPGYKLADSSGTFTGPNRKSALVEQVPRGPPTEATRQAAEAALARLSSQQKRDTNAFTSLAAIQAQVRKELEVERINQDNDSNTSSTTALQKRPLETDFEASPLLAVRGVYFRCPIISEEVLSRDTWRVRIKEFLYEQLEEERGLTACLIVHSCNYNRMKVKECVDVLTKYLNNIINNPEETKFHKIRSTNPTFADKVLQTEGATELLYAAGFRQQMLDHQGVPEEFYVFDIANVEGIETLEFLKDALNSEDRIEIELDRNLQVLSPGQASKRVDLPPDFYALSAEDLKKEQQLRNEALEKQLQLRTKAMREKDELREIRKYKFALIRIRFPDGLYLQGTFSVYEKFAEVIDFLKDNLYNPSEDNFILTAPTGHKFEKSERDLTLYDLRLVPATILTFQPKFLAQDESGSTSEVGCYLKPEIMILVQST